MTKGETVQIEQVANGGFIVSPKDVMSLTDPKREIYAFSTMGELEGFLRDHFREGERKLKAVNG